MEQNEIESVRKYHYGTLGKPRPNNHYPNSRNWKFKRMVSNILSNVYGYNDIIIQLIIINNFIVDGNRISCAGIILKYRELFCHYVESTDFI